MTLINPTLRHACLAVIASLALSHANSALAAGAEALITFTVHDPASGARVGGASVVVLTKYSGSVAARGSTDANGEGTFRLGERHVSASYYVVNVSASGYETASMPLSVMGADMGYTIALKRKGEEVSEGRATVRGRVVGEDQDQSESASTCDACGGSGSRYVVAGRKNPDGSTPVREVRCSACRGSGRQN